MEQLWNGNECARARHLAALLLLTQQVHRDTSRSGWVVLEASGESWRGGGGGDGPVGPRKKVLVASASTEHYMYARST